MKQKWLKKKICHLQGHAVHDYAKYAAVFEPPEQAWACDRCGEDFGTCGPPGPGALQELKDRFRRWANTTVDKGEEDPF